MKENRISVSVNYINGGMQEILENATPKQALDSYLFPDSGMPITWCLKAKSKDGKEVSIVVDKDSVEIFID